MRVSSALSSPAMLLATHTYTPLLSLVRYDPRTGAPSSTTNNYRIDHKSELVTSYHVQTSPLGPSQEMVGSGKPLAIHRGIVSRVWFLTTTSLAFGLSSTFGMAERERERDSV